jgi:hypothetical protein
VEEGAGQLQGVLEFCVANNIKKTMIPKDKFASLLKKTLENNAVNNAKNVKAGFAACGIIPFNLERVLSKLPGRQCKAGGPETAKPAAVGPAQTC